MGSHRAFVAGRASVVSLRRPPLADRQTHLNGTNPAKRLIPAYGVPLDPPKALSLDLASSAAPSDLDERWAKNRPAELVKQGSRQERMGEP